MALSPDQRATLALLLERGQRYSDLATLLGTDEAEVRGRARAALAELAGADPDRRVGLTDYLLGQADPIGRADASRHLRADPDDRALATSLAAQLREMFPEADLPRLPGEPRPGRIRRRPRPAERKPAAGEPTATGTGPGGLSVSQTRLIAVLGAVAVLLIAAVLALTGAFGGDGGESAATDPATTTANDSGEQEIQRVELRPTGGGDAGGEASFGLATGDQPFVDLSIRGLDPAPAERQYVIWLMLTPKQGYPLSPISVSPQGTFEERFPIPAAVLPVVARVRFVEVSIASSAEIRRVVRDAIDNTALVLEAPGEPVLRGVISRARAETG